MGITAVDKIKIDKYLKTNNINEIYYLDMCEAIGKKDKINDLEFIEYFTDCVLGEFSKNEKISIKHLNKLIYTIDAFLEWIHESKQAIKEETLDKIRSFSDFYNDYLIRTGTECDEEFKEKSIGMLLTNVNKLYPSKEKDESITKYINRIDELEETIKTIKKQLADATKQKDKLQATYERKCNKVDSLSSELSSIKKDVKAKDKEIIRLNKTIEALNSKLEELQVLLDNSKEEIINLENFKNECELLKQEVSKLNAIIEDYLKEKESISNLQIRQSKLEELIFQKLLTERVTLDGILKYINKKGFVTSREELQNLLKNIKNRISITSNSFSTSPTYRIVRPSVLKNGQFTINVPNRCQYYDIMLVSDFHIEKIDDKVIKQFDILNNYCTKEGINLILNLGDFFNGIGGNALNYANAVENYKLIESAINSIPSSEGLYHAVLGGNHEMGITRYGFDPIKFLSDEREDFINLGYNHSTILLNNSSNELGQFDIHHPDSFDFPIDLTSDGIDIAKFNNCLNEIYTKQGRNREDSYIDIFGHMHKNQINYLESYCYLAPYIRDTQKSGATHLRIYFDGDKKIKYMVFMPLSVNEKLIKNNEIIYQKVLTK